MTSSLRGMETRTLSGPKAAPEEPSASLLVIAGDRCRRHPLPPRGSLTIGRADDADIAITDASVSRKHAVISISAGVAVLEDSDSHNGSVVNGATISSACPLVNGDVIELGDVVLVFQSTRQRARLRQALGATELVGRLADEVERALRFRRGLAVIALLVPDYAGNARTIELACVAAMPTPCDVGWLESDMLIIVSPELGGSALRETTYAILNNVVDKCPGGRIGVASCPHDGLDAGALIASARAAASAHGTERVAVADDVVNYIDIAGRPVVVVDPAMRKIFDLLKRIATTDLAVLVIGETGVGKEHTAQAVHHWSHRQAGPFIAVNCAALPENLIESELFGYKKGAFSGADRDHIGFLEAANHGTLFLDELGELSLLAQAKLLRALDTKQITPVGEVNARPVDFRIIAATNRDLEQDVRDGHFREDLLFRVNASQIELPPLRERPRELPLLARALLAAACERAQRELLELTDATLGVLAAHEWPGNVRELRNAMDYVAASVEGDVVEPQHLPSKLNRDDSALGSVRSAPGSSRTTNEFRPIAEELEELERRRMVEALEATGGIRTHAADLIGMPRRTFTMKLKKYQITE